jgi:hypothetical protein
VGVYIVLQRVGVEKGHRVVEALRGEFEQPVAGSAKVQKQTEKLVKDTKKDKHESGSEDAAEARAGLNRDSGAQCGAGVGVEEQVEARRAGGDEAHRVGEGEAPRRGGHSGRGAHQARTREEGASGAQVRRLV